MRKRSNPMLTGKQKQYLKAIAVNFPAMVQIGKEGLAAPVIDSAEAAIAARELIKVKVNQNSEEEISHTAAVLAEALQCEIVQIIGRSCILFRQKEKKSHYELP